MMKRETLKQTRSVVFKMDFYVDNQRHAQIIDSHLEALDKIEQLEAAVEAAKKDAWKEGYDACARGDQRHNPFPRRETDGQVR